MHSVWLWVCKRQIVSLHFLNAVFRVYETTWDGQMINIMILLVLFGSICGDLKVLQIYMSRVLTRITQMSNCIKNKTINKNFIWGKFVSRKSIRIIQKQFSIRGFGTQRAWKKNLPKPSLPPLAHSLPDPWLCILSICEFTATEMSSWLDLSTSHL